MRLAALGVVVIRNSTAVREWGAWPHLRVGRCQLLQGTCWCLAELAQRVQRVEQLIRQVGVLAELHLEAVQLFAKLQLLVVAQRLIHATTG
jgi:hypothetical protein